MNTLAELKKELREAGNPEKAKLCLRFFKCGAGEYGEGDKFLGVVVPAQRKISKNFSDLSLKDLGKLLTSGIHEERQTALFILVRQFEKGEEKARKKIFDFYLANAERVNNWDLVDCSAHKIAGAYLLDKDKKILCEMAQSENLWKRRIAVISTFAFIRAGNFSDSLKIAEILLRDKHDLIHKAVGWMLREAGNRDRGAEIKFLEKFAPKMPRTMLRYAVEKFSPAERRKFLISNS